MKTIITLAFLFFSLIPFAQEVNRKITDEKAKSEILIGVCNKQGLMQAPFTNWYTPEFNRYSPDTKILSELKKYAGKWRVNIVFGTWCSDSQREVPRFFKIAENVGLSSDDIKIIAVDSQKTGGDVDISGLKIEKVPAFIFFKEDKEIGRIVETPKVNIETDLLNILKQ
jgi:hypothetical protein